MVALVGVLLSILNIGVAFIFETSALPPLPNFIVNLGTDLGSASDFEAESDDKLVFFFFFG